MTDTVNLQHTKADIEIALRRVVRQIMQRREGSPQFNGQLSSCLSCISHTMMYDGEAQLPSPVPSITGHGRNPHSENIVLHDIKQAILRYWELCRTDQTVGLQANIRQLEAYADHGWTDTAWIVLGSEADGYYLAYTDSTAKPPGPQKKFSPPDLPSA